METTPTPPKPRNGKRQAPRKTQARAKPACAYPTMSFLPQPPPSCPKCTFMGVVPVVSFSRTTREIIAQRFTKRIRQRILIGLQLAPYLPQGHATLFHIGRLRLQGRAGRRHQGSVIQPPVRQASRCLYQLCHCRQHLYPISTNNIHVIQRRVSKCQCPLGLIPHFYYDPLPYIYYYESSCQCPLGLIPHFYGTPSKT